MILVLMDPLPVLIPMDHPQHQLKAHIHRLQLQAKIPMDHHLQNLRDCKPTARLTWILMALLPVQFCPPIHQVTIWIPMEEETILIPMDRPASLHTRAKPHLFLSPSYNNTKVFILLFILIYIFV